jgi:uncharacterized protein
MVSKYFRFVAYLIVTIGFSVSHAGAYVDFFRAVDRDDPMTVADLLSRGFDPNAPSERGQVGLYLALKGDSPKVFKVLMQHPALKIDLANSAGETPLMMAALRGEVDAMKQLLARGAQLNRNGWTPLHYAASAPEPNAVALLLERGAVVDALAPNGTTALMMAAQYGTEDAAMLLLKQGANPQLRNGRGQTAADLARVAERDKLAAKLEPRGR